MKRWTGPVVVAILAALSVLLSRSTSSILLRDTDTIALLDAIRQRKDPLSWFLGDWPLFNHFYRPISTLAFELDNYLYGQNAAGYGWTNAIIASICVLLLAWFLREITDKPAFTIVGTLAFAHWHLPSRSPALFVLDAMLLAAFFGGVFRHGLRISKWAPPVLILLAIQELLSSGPDLGSAVVTWLPGRTASVMTVFCLIALAAYARYERLGSEPPIQPLAATDLPATRMTRLSKKASAGLLWPLGAVVCVALALGAYEQAVMLPATLLGIAVSFRWRGHQVRWAWHGAFWAVLVGYLALRHSLVPSDVSGYQAQQFRAGGGVWISILEYVFPALNGIPGWLITITAGWEIFFTWSPYVAIVNAARDIVTVWKSWRKPVLIVTGWILAFLAYLPMAWLKPFAHYQYWPLALRSLLVAGLFFLAVELIVTAWSRPSSQAPQRLDPAPGSLPRP